jgi:hypothetical protein
VLPQQVFDASINNIRANLTQINDGRPEICLFKNFLDVSV